MSGWNGFANLDLSSVEADDYAPLTKGEYEVTCTKAEIKTAANGKDKRVVVNLKDTGGAGSIAAGFNVVHTSSPQAQDIGLRQLKSFLVSGNHPNPDKPGDIESMIGLTCRIYVDLGKPYQKNGQTVQREEVKRFIIDGDAPAPSPQAKKSADLDDEIPF